MDIRLRQIVSKAAGIYFIVTDNSQVNAIEEESRLRVVFINAPKGPVNCLVKFAKGDTSSFTTIFGKANRSKEKKGDFGHKVCLDALSSGPLGVINLRVFNDEEDTTQVASINPNTCFTSGVKGDRVPYSSLFNKNGYWTPDRNILTEKYYADSGFLNFGNVGNSDVSIFVVKAKTSDVSRLTEEYEKTLEECALEIDDYPNLDFNTRLCDTFVKVYVFNNSFQDAHLNATYGQYFNSDDTITQENLELLTQVTGVGFVDSFVGSVIPNLMSETSENLSIDDIMYANYVYTGIICDINNELLEATRTRDFSMIDLFGFNSMFEDGAFTEISNLMSYNNYTHVFDFNTIVPATPANLDENRTLTCKDAIKYGVVDDDTLTLNTFKTNTVTGIRYDDLIMGEDRLLHITDISLEEPQSIPSLQHILESDNCNLVETQTGALYLITGNRFATSNDGVNWRLVDDVDVTFGGSVEYITGRGIRNTVVTYGPAVYALAIDANEQIFIVKYKPGQITKKALSGIDAKPRIAINGNIFVVYSQSGVLYSTDGENWSQSSVGRFDYVMSGIGTEYRFIGYIASGGMSDGFGGGFDEGDTILAYSSDGQTWTLLTSNYREVLNRVEHGPNPLFCSGSFVYFISAQHLWGCRWEDLMHDGARWDQFNVDGLEAGGDISSQLTSVIYYTEDTIYFMTGVPDGPRAAHSPFICKIGESSNSGVGVEIQPTFQYSNFFVAQNSKKVYITGLEREDHDLYKMFEGSQVVANRAPEILIPPLTDGTFTMPYYLEYQEAVYTVDGKLYVGDNNGAKFIVKVNPYVNHPSAILNKNVIQSYKLSERQFINGTSSRQSEILDMIMDPSIRKGLKNTRGLRYLIDAFKSYVEPNYKKQFSNLVLDLHENNRFVTCIMNEPFMSDIKKSTNPLFKDTPSSDVVNYEYFATGGNKQYSTKLLEKVDNQFLFFFGPGDIQNGVTKPLSGLISNNFYNKQYQFDIIANTTGYVQGITELEEQIDDNDRKYLEKFRYNPIIDFNGYTIFGNLSAQKAISKQQQIHNVELLCYIKEQLYNMAKGGVFKKGTYDEYLATQIETQNFMDSLALANAIEPNPIVKCDLENNTQELRNYKIKLVHVEYTPYDCLEKVVFDLNINK